MQKHESPYATVVPRCEAQAYESADNRSWDNTRKHKCN